MKTVFVVDLNPGDDLVNEPFLIQEILRRKTKDGRSFLLGSLRDKTGQLACVFWDVPDYVEHWVRSGMVVLVSGRVANYKDALQISITDMNDLHNPDMSDFLPSSNRSIPEMVDELKQRVAALSEPWQTLVTHLLLDEHFLPRFSNAPAARNMHHAFIGGLLEHSLSMASIADQLADHYPYVNKDLLMTGTLLHDLGKAIEYTVDESFDFTEDGRLVGHIVRGIVLIEKGAAEIGGFPQSELRQLIHLVASHHGTQEWGSPVVPKTLEAVLLHQIDLLDSRVQGFMDHINSDEGNGPWTVKNSYMFKTELQYPPNME
ncbi:MAG: HD domain-containing protein [Anaerolineales bacterium]|nr:HD domain-containing protein [Anaerolineales bacterium]